MWDEVKTQRRAPRLCYDLKCVRVFTSVRARACVRVRVCRRLLLQTGHPLGILRLGRQCRVNRGILGLFGPAERDRL